MLNGVRALLQGKKTYVVLAAAGLVWAGNAGELIPDPIAATTYEFLGWAGGITIAAKINRLAKGTLGQVGVVMLALLAATLLLVGCAGLTRQDCEAQVATFRAAVAACTIKWPDDDRTRRQCEATANAALEAANAYCQFEEEEATTSE